MRMIRLVTATVALLFTVSGGPVVSVGAGGDQPPRYSMIFGTASSTFIAARMSKSSHSV